MSIALLALLTGCGPTSGSSYVASGPSATCESLRDTVLDRIRTDDTSDTINDELQDLTDYCPDDYNFVTSYNALWMEADLRGVQACDIFVGRASIDPAALELFRSEGHCTEELPEPPTPAWPNGGLGWNEAGNHIGTVQRVCGPLRSARNTEWGIFVNVGEDYPSLARFTFVIWGDWWIDPSNSTAVICATGPVSLYEGVTQMELSHPGELEIWAH